MLVNHEPAARQIMLVAINIKVDYNWRYMKHCPVCRNTYTDETLRFCLADGAPLNDLAGEQETVVRTAGQQMRVDIPQVPSIAAPPPVKNAGAGNGLKIVLVILVVGILAIVVLGVGGLVFYRSMRNQAAANDTLHTPSPTPPPAKDEKDDLRDQIANLEKLINEQKNSNRSANGVPPAVPDQPTATTGTARVNSPADGFLALRTYPSSSVGDRITQIPHGASVSIGGCLGSTRIGSKTGRWCRATYKGYSGWVFDAWLVY